VTHTPPSSVLDSVSGFSGAPHALRLVQALAAVGREPQSSVSDSGAIVLPVTSAFSSRPQTLRDAVDHAGAARPRPATGALSRSTATRSASPPCSAASRHVTIS
jgi:3-polyprenyl-4-hydroxybenzoate decarboxylase